MAILGTSILSICTRVVRHRCLFRRLHSVVRPGIISAERSVPPEIVTPDYVLRPGGQPNDPPRQIPLLSGRKISALRDACAVARDVLEAASERVQPGVTTDEIDCITHERCLLSGAYPSPLRYRGFPKSVCTSVNNVVCHGIPDDYALREGDIINVDVTVFYNGYHGDTSATFLVGEVDASARHLVDVARRCRDKAIDICRPGQSFCEIGRLISSVCTLEGFNVVPEFCGHGIGRFFHGPPDIFHCENNQDGVMQKGMAFTIEPIITEGNPAFEIQEDGWTAMTVDQSRSAQFEHTIVITDDCAEILT